MSRLVLLASLLVLTAVVVSQSDHAVAHDELTAADVQRMKSDGSLAQRIARVRRLEQSKLAPSLRQAASYKMRKGALRAAGLSDAEIATRIFGDGPMSAFPFSARPELKSQGTVRTLTLLIDFHGDLAGDRLPGITRDKVQANLYGAGTPSAQAHKPYESLNRYYHRASQGRVDVTGEVLDWYTFSKQRAKYLPKVGTTDQQQLRYDNQALWSIFSEVLAAHDATHDYSQYDNDNDGDIDLVTVLYSGATTGWGSFWWAYRWEFFVPESYTRRFDGKRVKQFVFQNVGVRDGTEFDPKVLLHEMGHAFGLADYYDYDPKKGPPGGIGGLDMMHANWGNHNAFSRWLLDWVEPTVIGEGAPATHTLVAAGAEESHSKALAIFPSLGDTDAPGQEMFVVENRHRIGNDGGRAELPSDGLLVWHVLATPNAGDDGFAMDNSYTDRKLIRLVRANSAVDFKHREYADGLSYFNKTEEFTPSSSPSSAAYDGSPTGIHLTDISEDGPVMTLRAGFKPVGPQPQPGPIAAPPIPDSLPVAGGPEVDLEKLELFHRTLARASAEELSAMWKKVSEALPATGVPAACQRGLSCRVLLSQWAGRDGEAALAAVKSLPVGETRDELHALVMQAWIENDANGATAWYLTSREQQNPLAPLESGLTPGPRFTRALFKRLGKLQPERALAAVAKLGTRSELWGAIQGLRQARPEAAPEDEANDTLVKGLRELSGTAGDILEAQEGLEDAIEKLPAGARKALESHMEMGTR